MADLALNDSLINEYLAYRFEENYDRTKIRKLFKYIQPFPLKDSYDLMNDPSIAMQLESDPLIEIVGSCTNEELVQNTILKLMLIDSASSSNYRTLNINDSYEKLKPKYVGTYPNNFGKNKAQEHIKALLSDAQWIKITDGYIATPRQWSANKSIVRDIVPIKILDLTIVGADKDDRRLVINANEKEELKSICNDWTIIGTSLNNNIHDRYIETNKLKILLSSGIEHLSSASNKDFTYVVEIK